MNKSIRNLFFGKDNTAQRDTGVAIVAFIALGCGCGKDFDLAKIGDQNANSTRSTSSNSSSSTSDGSMPSSELIDALVSGDNCRFYVAIR